jgi:hypothetical protein
MDMSEKHDRNSVPFLIGTVVLGIAILVTAAVMLRKPVVTASPFDEVPAPAAAAPAVPGETAPAPIEPAAPK